MNKFDLSNYHCIVSCLSVSVYSLRYITYYYYHLRQKYTTIQLNICQALQVNIVTKFAKSKIPNKPSWTLNQVTHFYKQRKVLTSKFCVRFRHTYLAFAVESTQRLTTDLILPYIFVQVHNLTSELVDMYLFINTLWFCY